METLSLIGNAFAGMMNPMSILLLIVGVAVGIVFGHPRPVRRHGGGPLPAGHLRHAGP